ncbi:MAG: putative quorum-quenching lactonase YtnP [Calditrichaeota bacterium]|nr:putative quorum-quenching lactonase YtnP [Calditrichota bacterium]
MKFGEFELFLIEDGGFRLDGGAMFGVVPRVLWAKTDPPDERNRIRLACNCMLVKTGDANVLIDTGCGGKWSDKEHDIFAVDEPRTLITDLARVDLSREEITHVVLTHLHFDHAGGGTFIDNDGGLKVQFPNATYYVQRGEWEIANDPNPRDARSFKPENMNPLADAGVLELIEGDTEILPGIRTAVTGGHTKYHQIVFVESGGQTAVFNGDLVPTASHLPLPYVMAYDLYPLQTMKFKAPHLKQAHEQGWLMVFEHGAREKAGHLRVNEKGRYELAEYDMDEEVYSPPSD